MRYWMVPILVVGCLALPSRAQETLPVMPRSGPEALPAPECDIHESCQSTYELHWLERTVPRTVTTMVPREVVTPDTKTIFEVEYNKEQRSRTVMVLKPCETIKEVTRCTQKPKVVTDPCTGCPTVVFEPVTETKQVKEITYELVPEEKVVVVETACLKPVEKAIARKTMVLECTTETVMKKERFGVLVPVEIKERKPACRPTPCVP